MMTKTTDAAPIEMIGALIERDGKIDLGPGPITLADVHRADRTHRAYDADYCPLCGTARKIGG